MTCPHPTDRTVVHAPPLYRVRRCWNCGGWRVQLRRLSKQKVAIP